MNRLQTIAGFIRRNFFRRLDVYFYRELVPNYFFGVAFFTFLMLLNELFFLIKFNVEYNVPLSQVFLLLMNLIPFLLTYTIPVGVLPSYLLTMGRLSVDSEVIAMKSCGISTFRIFRPGILFGILISLFSIVFTDRVAVSANMNYIKLRARIIAQKPAVELKEKSFVEIGGYKLSFERLSMESGVEVLYNIHMVDINGRKTIEAEKGRFFTDPENPEHYILKFQNGSISEVNKNTQTNGQSDEKFFVASFRYLSVHTYVNMPQEFYQKGPDTMSLAELTRDIAEKSKTTLDQIRNYLKDRERVSRDIDRHREELKVLTKNLSREEILEKTAEWDAKIKALRSQIDSLNRNIDSYRKNLPNYQIMKLHEKFALPLSALGFAMVCLAIGLFTPRSGRNEGLGLSIIAMLVFYGTKIGTENLIIKGFLPPWFEWFPVLVFFTAGITLLAVKIRE